ncbi:DNA glycosylase AlkZ-like family protein [Pseudoclavibacter endophyticus]|nr:crosslink repair DNA glycosylase YcaQ family protein [Pseudoclavibacter endophyticus]
MSATSMTVTREQALRYRWRATGLDAEPGDAVLPELAALDLGVQEGANAAGVIGLVNRGVTPAEAIRCTSGFTEELALAWTVRGAPQYIRRRDLADVEVAVSPFSDRDASKRVLLADRDFAAAAVEARDGMRVVATAMREALADAAVDAGATGESARMSKGELSGRLTATLPRPYLVDCRPCRATHPQEQLFRICALHAGVELEPGTNPPRLRIAPEWPERPVGPEDDPSSAPAALQVIRAYLHLLGPASPRDVAAFLETNVGEVKPRWPDDVREVEIDGHRASMLAADLDALAAAADAPAPRDAAVRLLSGFDLLLAAKDRERLVSDPIRRKQLWPVLGRPGVVAVDGDPVGVWRPRSKGKALTVRVELWGGSGSGRARHIDAIDTQAERIAQARDQRLSRVEIA